jgi:hypothetical protein
MDYILHIWYWFKSKTPHKCENWQTFLGNQNAGVVFCSICAKIMDEKTTRDE